MYYWPRPFPTIHKTGSELVPVNVTIHRWQGGVWTRVDFDDRCYLYGSCREEALWLAYKLVQECKRDVNGEFLYHELRSSSIAVRFKANVRLSSLDYAVAATQKVLGSEHPNPSPAGAVLSVLMVTHDHKADWDFGEMPSVLSSGREHGCMDLGKILDMVSRMVLAAPENDFGCIAP